MEDTITINENDPILTTLSSSPTLCYGSSNGGASVIASGGTGNLIYNWSNGGNSTVISNQIYGDYWVKVEDDLGCFKIDTITISQPSVLKVQLISSDVKCYGGTDGSITSNVSGGTAPYTYDWSLGQNSFSTSPTATGLPSTNVPYVLTATDANSCKNSVLSFVNQPEPLYIDSTNIVPAYCANIPTGEVSVYAVGGFLNTNSSYSFLWDSGETESVLINKNAGLYTVVVEDDNSCKDSLNIEIPLIETFSLVLSSDSLNSLQRWKWHGSCRSFRRLFTI